MNEETKIKIKQPPVLFHKTQTLIKKIETALGGTLITYWNNPNGQICHNDLLAFYELLEKMGRQTRIYIFIKSDGGHGQASLRIVNLLRKYCNELVALIPLECASAATMMALGADEIYMGPMAYLTAVDTSLTHDLSPVDNRNNDKVSVSLDELNRVIKLWKKEKSDESDNPYKSLFAYVHPLVIGAVDRADSLSIMICKELLSYHITDEIKVEKISQTLNSKYPSHNYPILLEEVQNIGLNVKPMVREVNGLLLELNEIYSEMGQKATTDFSEIKSHGNEILNILEAKNLQIYFQQDKDWYYRGEERRWITMNDNSSWRKVERTNNKTNKSIFHIA
jgi:Serine dehydrogenase proteinase